MALHEELKLIPRQQLIRIIRSSKAGVSLNLAMMGDTLVTECIVILQTIISTDIQEMISSFEHLQLIHVI